MILKIMMSKFTLNSFCQVHSSCLTTLPNSSSVCQFGILEPIFLPPSAISSPRTQFASAVPIKPTREVSLMQARKYWDKTILLNYLEALRSKLVHIQMHGLFQFATFSNLQMSLIGNVIVASYTDKEVIYIYQWCLG